MAKKDNWKDYVTEVVSQLCKEFPGANIEDLALLVEKELLLRALNGRTLDPPLTFAGELISVLKKADTEKEMGKTHRIYREETKLMHDYLKNKLIRSV